MQLVQDCYQIQIEAIVTFFIVLKARITILLIKKVKTLCSLLRHTCHPLITLNIEPRMVIIC